MKLTTEQTRLLEDTFTKAGLPVSNLNYKEIFKEIYFVHKIESTYRFQIRDSIQGDLFCDVFCEPYTYSPTIYRSCDTFADCLKLAKDWATVAKYKLSGKNYYNKIFISHSSKDQSIIDSFVERILRLSCGYDLSEIVYTSKQMTGVEPGEHILSFIKENILTSGLVLFMISQNYKRSEVCLNEMGVAWALDKRIVPILLPDTSFNDIGWLTSLNKAIKINDNEGLDKLYSMISRDNTNIMDWNLQRDQFIKYCVNEK